MTLLLTRSDLEDLVSPAEVVDAVGQSMVDVAEGVSQQPTMPAVRLAGADAQFLPMVAAGGPQGLAAAKFLADVPTNRARGLPTQRSVLVLLSAETGACEAVIHGAVPTRLRTAATSAVATQELAGRGRGVLGLVGAGALAVEHVAALSTVMALEHVLVWSRSDATVDAFVRQVTARTSDLKITVLPSARDVVEQADVVCTLTPSKNPVVHGAWFHPGLHVNAVGAPPRPDHREIDGAGMAAAHVVVDARSTAQHESGDVLLAVAEGAITADHCHDELGEVLVGSAPGRRDADEITLFNSVGLGIQDLAVGRLLLDAARRCGRGRVVDLSA